ncbi:hypothetical protein PG5_43020 [Pseudomonas sp. G5(2012)]|nr:hypothetical protein PG5_43020 [Pseudomonas sp. G5(2012)]
MNGYEPRFKFCRTFKEIPRQDFYFCHVVSSLYELQENSTLGRVVRQHALDEQYLLAD